VGEPRTLRREPLTSADYERMPVFTFEDEPAAATVSRAAMPAAALVVWVAALLMTTVRWRVRTIHLKNRRLGMWRPPRMAE
jgi:hypothetical protein